jgi:hypothetical protein
MAEACVIISEGLRDSEVTDWQRPATEAESTPCPTRREDEYEWWVGKNLEGEVYHQFKSLIPASF